MNIALVVAMAKNRVIGSDQKMPWHLPADLQHFRRLTLHKPVIMGRKTYESIGRPLPQRRNLVVTRQDLSIPGVEIFPSVTAALAAVQESPQIMVIGGQTIFEQTIALASSMYITEICCEIPGDTFFPLWEPSEWELCGDAPYHRDAANPYVYRFLEYRRQMR